MKRLPKRKRRNKINGDWMGGQLFKNANPNWKGGPILHSCQICGKEFQSYIKTSKYCSDACIGKSQQRRILKVCENCGKEFETHKCYEKRVTCCSMDCKYALTRKKSIKPVICKGCGIEFFQKIDRTKISNVKSPSLFHSPECLKAWRKKRYSGKKNPRWLGGTVAYRGSDWDIQRKKAAERDNYTCQICFAIPEKINVHHIIPYRKTQNNSLDNLITLCSVCHGTEENAFRRLNKPSLKVRWWQKTLLDKTNLDTKNG